MTDRQKLYIGLVVLVAAGMLFAVIRYWRADYHYAMGIAEAQQGFYEASVKDTQTAIDLSPTEAIYHNQMSRIFTSVASGLSKTDATSAAQLVPYAEVESDLAYELSPRNMNIIQSRITMYLQLAQFKPNYLQLALNLILDTIPLSPTDPKLELMLGKVYANSGQIKKAKEALNKALELKPDYNEAKNDLQILQNKDK